ncbi:MAG: DUF523 and DUF1722 domain-containing protein [bacterium]|uniref:DUF523 and DUF1722 domain-containing protein n=1 Tax=Candidatus Methylomirabilis tolerans TaxID=3123416 RepID=A0AAJ1AIF2_9BACT|nr:DUF523 and DUF1722 domain-containing protein [Candidatus Methylomirabilis sp.]
MKTNTEFVEHGCWQSWHSADVPLRLGVSSCLIGEKVRFDGGHARDRFVTDTLGQWFELAPVCPEMEIGMGAPRPTVRLVEEGRGTRLVAPSNGKDFTELMLAYATDKVAELFRLGLDGYIVKKASPSCGMERIRVYRNGVPVARNESGLFARTLMEHWPALPVEEDGRLNDPILRENFIERAFSRNRWRVLVRRGLSRRRLIQFHTAHKLLLRAHNEAAYRRLGKLVGSAGTIPDRELFDAYESEFHESLRTVATRKKHTNVLLHALGYLKNALDAIEKREVLATIEDFRQGLVPLVVPVALLRYGIRRHSVEYLPGQLYFDPHPKELMLRNHP